MILRYQRFHTKGPMIDEALSVGTPWHGAPTAAQGSARCSLVWRMRVIEEPRWPNRWKRSQERSRNRSGCAVRSDRRLRGISRSGEEERDSANGALPIRRSAGGDSLFELLPVNPGFDCPMLTAFLGIHGEGDCQMWISRLMAKTSISFIMKYCSPVKTCVF
jgi:hypothetical protein